MGIFPGWPMPLYVCCDQCGAAVSREHADQHKCDPERVLDYTLVKLRPDIAAFEHDFHAWVSLSPVGRFEAMYAERDRTLGRVKPLHAEAVTA